MKPFASSNGTQSIGFAGLQGILTERFGERARHVVPQTTAADIPGWDSLQMVNIILEVESRFGIVFRNRDIDAIRNVGDFASLIDRMVVS